MSRNPASILYTASGIPVAITPNQIVSLSTPGFLVLGSDGEQAKSLKVSEDGSLSINTNGEALLVQQAGVFNSTSTQSGVWDIRNVTGTIPLATNAATESTLANVLTTADFASRVNTLGQKSMSGSTSVVIASNQSVLTVSGVVTGNFFQAIQPVSGTVAISNLPSTQPISGSVSVSNFPSSQTVNGSISISNFPATQAVSGTVAATQSGTWTITLPTGASTSALQTTGNTSLSNIDNKTPSLGQAVMTASSPVVIASNQSAIPVTGTFFQSTQPVSGTITANAGTGTFTVGGSVSVSNFPSTQTVSGSVNATVSGSVSVSNFPASQTVSGTVAVSNFPATQPISASALPLPSGASTSAAQTTGNASLASIDTKTPSLGQALLAASVPVAIASNQGPLAVTGTFFQATQPISGTVGINNFPSTQTINGTVASTQSGTWNITNISGTVSLPTGAATAAKQPALGTAGTASSDVLTVQGIASMIALKVDGSAVTQPVSGSISISNFPATQPVSGSISVSNFPASQAVTGTISVGNFPATQAISASTLPLPTGAATEATLTTINNKMPALGQAVMASSQPVTIASNQSAIPVYLTDNPPATYSAAAVSFVPSTTAPTDIFTITGSATKVVKVLQVTIVGTQTTGAMRDIVLIKRSTANTGGTSTTLVNAPHDSTTAAASAVVRSYTANPSALGTSVGTVKAKKMFIGAPTVAASEWVVDFGNSLTGNAPVILRGVNESLAVNLNGVVSTGNSFTIHIEWTEE